MQRLNRLHHLTFLILFTWLSCPLAEAQPPAGDQQPRWWKGNLHTHSLWSDGDEFPEMIASWYHERDYNFLALSDHNVLSQGIRFMPYEKIVQRSDEGVLERYREKFGEAWVETQGEKGSESFEVRLKPLDEFRCLVEEAGKFIMIQGEEISDRAEGKPVHMNATNLRQLLEPAGGSTVLEAIQNNLRMVIEHERETGRPVMPHLNHPNFGYAVTAHDLAHAIEEQFFEVYNGHPGVNQLGDDKHISIEAMWDVINAIRMVKLDADPILGIATDDSHEYHGRPGSRPGRGWVMVRSHYLTPEHLIRAMRAGDFYASSGVVLDRLEYDSQSRTIDLSISPVAGASFTTEFIGIRRVSDDLPDDNGAADDEAAEALPAAEVFATREGLTASYRLTGEELYVRARVTSSLAPHDPSYEGQRQQAWTQPVGWRE